MQETILNTLQLVLAILLTITILLQQKGGGLGGILGGSNNVYSTKRGVDKILHTTTIILAILFFCSSLSRLVF
jgi:preprotein translocase subunit SecG